MYPLFLYSYLGVDQLPVNTSVDSDHGLLNRLLTVLRQSR